MTTPRLLSERYELGETLGYGGMSEVHRGLDTRLGRDVAVKVLRADLARDPQFQMRFRREAQNAAALNHPAIVAVYDTGEVEADFGPLPYIVMEYVDGQTLRDIVKTTGPMPQQRVIEVMADVCAALDFSHRHQIIHRDVKPANIMINHAGAVKVMDFGIARALGEGQNVTQTAAVIGTAQYLSPEQARGEAVDARSDVYAAGCVLFELLTGEPPFTGDTPVAVAYQHVREDPRHPSEIDPAIPPALDAVALKALSKNPANRYQSAAEMRADLVRVRSGQAPMAPVVMSEDERTAMLASPTRTGPTRRIGGGGGRHTMPPTAVPDYYDDEEPRRGVGRIVAIVAAALLVLALAGFALAQIFGGPAPPVQVAVPPMANQTEQDARNQLINLDLRPAAVSEPSDTVARGLVVRSDPPEGALVNAASSVTLVVSTGPAEVRIRALTGLTPQEAQAQIVEDGLVVGPVEERDTTDSNLVGRVISSDPAGGVTVPAGATVSLVVGREVTTREVPPVEGQNLDQARQTLAAAGFTDVEDTEVDGAGEEGEVLGTDPRAGQRVEPGTTITIQVSRGNQVTVPDLDGLDQNAVIQSLREAGFTSGDGIREQLRSVDDPRQDGRVIEQSIAPGEPFEDGDQLVITYGDANGGGGGNGNGNGSGGGGGDDGDN
jgi:serine/threonine-protein kinase